MGKKYNMFFRCVFVAAGVVLPVLALCCIPFPSYAQPRPSQHPVQDIQEQLEREKARELELKDRMKTQQEELSGTKGRLVSLAKKIKENESVLSKTEGDIARRRQEQLALEVKLNEDHSAISKLILAMERLRRVPSEAVLARPGAPLETAQTAMLLESILPKIHRRTQGLKENLEKLAEIVAALEADQAKALEAGKNLGKDYSALEVLLKKREGLYAQTGKDIKKQQRQLEAISKQARSLKDFVGRIERQQQLEEKRREQLAQQKNAPEYRQTPLPKAGEAQLPISGAITVSYGNTDDIGAVSEGIKIKGRPNALVVAPMGGVVEYAGPFRGYDQIVILKHRGRYHSLIAGLNKIDTVVGRSVKAGEPIGSMGNGGNSANSVGVLYYELRYKGKPINPSKKISGL